MTAPFKDSYRPRTYSPAHRSDRAALGACVARLTDHLASAVDDRGAVQDRCGSRILESVLMLALLRKERIYPDTQKTLTRFVRTRRAQSTLIELEKHLADASLSDPPHPADTAGLLAGFNHFTAARKRLMFTTYLAILGTARHDETVDPATIDYQGHASWVGMTLCAVKVLNAYGRGTPDLVGDEDRAFLTSQVTNGSRREVWEGHLSAYLLTLLAISEFAPGSRLVREGIDRTLRHRNRDGGLPFITDMTIFLTALAGSALRQAHADPALVRRMGEYVAVHQAPDGGWPYTEGITQTDVDDTSCSAEFLRAADSSRWANELHQAGIYLASLANPDGGFPTYRRGHASEATMTANAIKALAPEWKRYPFLTPAVSFLIRAQKPDGTFECSWSNSETYAISRVLHALSLATADQQERISPTRVRARKYLEGTQNPDGGWGHHPGASSDPISTAHALTACVLLGTPRWGAKALRYLLDRQETDGGYTSVPDQAAPRPIPYNFPVLADIFTLNALGHIRHLRQ